MNSQREMDHKMSSLSPSAARAQRRQVSPFTVGAHRMYNRKDSYAAANAAAVAVNKQKSESSLDDIPFRPYHRIGRARSSSFAGLSSEVTRSGGVGSLSSSSLLSNRSISPFARRGSSSSAAGITTPSDPSRTAYPPTSLTEHEEAARRRRKQLSEPGLGYMSKRLFEKVELVDEKLNWSTHALPSSSRNASRRSSITDSLRSLGGGVSIDEDEQGGIKREIKKTQQLRWGVVHLREYQMILGDNPSCEGAPLSLGWDWWVPKVTGGSSVGDGRHDALLRGTSSASSSSSHYTRRNSSSSNHGDVGDELKSEDSVYCLNSIAEGQNMRTVDQYEKRRGLRLRGNQLKLSPLAREAILKRMGVPQEEIEEASKANYLAQMERNANLAAMTNGGNNMQNKMELWVETVLKFFRQNGNGNNNGNSNNRFENGTLPVPVLRRTWSEPSIVPFYGSSGYEGPSCRGILKKKNSGDGGPAGSSHI